MPIVVFDLDGTLANAKHRLHLLPSANDKDTTHGWDAFNLACDEDLPIEDNLELLSDLYTAGNEIVILTGRCDIAKFKTQKWLSRNIPNVEHRLVMRQRGDHRRDVVFKQEALEGIMDAGGRILCCFDDLEHVVKHIRGMGITCHQVTHYDAPRLHEQDHREGEAK